MCWPCSALQQALPPCWNNVWVESCLSPTAVSLAEFSPWNVPGRHGRLFQGFFLREGRRNEGGPSLRFHRVEFVALPCVLPAGFSTPANLVKPGVAELKEGFPTVLCHRVLSVALCSLVPDSLHTRLALRNESVVTARMQPSVVSPQKCEAVSAQTAGRFPHTCHLVKPHYECKAYRRTMAPQSSHGGHLAFSTPSRWFLGF